MLEDRRGRLHICRIVVGRGFDDRGELVDRLEVMACNVNPVLREDAQEASDSSLRIRITVSRPWASHATEAISSGAARPSSAADNEA